jgi:receptor expression-enhancing protein 5/6
VITYNIFKTLIRVAADIWISLDHPLTIVPLHFSTDFLLQTTQERRTSVGRACIEYRSKDLLRIRDTTLDNMAQSLAVQIDYITKQIQKSPYAKYAVKFEETTKVNPAYVLLGFAAITIALVFAGIGGSLITNLVGFVYPMLCSIRAIESRQTEDDTQWLTYWVVYAFFNLLDSLSSYILYWIPFFYPLKLVLLLWCMLPQFKA